MAADSDVQMGQDPFDSGPADKGFGSETVRWDKMMNPLNWSFMNEPAWKWAIFFIATSLFLVAWRGVLNYMK